MPVNMKTRLTALCALMAALFTLPGALTAAPIDRFFAAAPGIPVVEGMFEDASRKMVFDSPQGRIVETAAQGNRSWADVQTFYLGTLPQLGWQVQEKSPGKLEFRRARERLLLQKEAGAGALLRFGLVIKPAG